MKENHIIHCDLKPENIILKNREKSGIKMIDFGSSCFDHEVIYTYIQSRFYRAPEIMLGIPYTEAIDMWSFAAILVELFIGYPVFPGENEADQLALIMQYKGIPPINLLQKSSRRHHFFTEDFSPLQVKNKRGKVRKPNTKSFSQLLEGADKSFVKFIDACFHWDPDLRLTPEEALSHEWILKGLPRKILEEGANPLLRYEKLNEILDSSESDSSYEIKADTASEKSTPTKAIP